MLGVEKPRDMDDVGRCAEFLFQFGQLFV